MTTATTVRLPDDLYDRLRMLAFATRRPMNELVIECLRRSLSDVADKDEAVTP